MTVASSVATSGGPSADAARLDHQCDQGERGVEVRRVEVGPRPLREEHLGAGDLPEHEVGDAQLSRRADEDVDGRELGHVEVLRDRRLADRLAGTLGLLGGVDQLGAAAVVERDREHHAGVAGRVAKRLGDRSLHVLRRARLGRVERPAHPPDPHVQVVQLVDPGEQLAVQTEDVADLGPGSHPVLGREAEHRELADVAGHGDPHECGEVLLAHGVALGAGEVAAPRPPAVAVHDARDVDVPGGAVGGRVRSRCRGDQGTLPVGVAAVRGASAGRIRAGSDSGDQRGTMAEWLVPGLAPRRAPCVCRGRCRRPVRAPPRDGGGRDDGGVGRAVGPAVVGADHDARHGRRRGRRPVVDAAPVRAWAGAGHGRGRSRTASSTSGGAP